MEVNLLQTHNKLLFQYSDSSSGKITCRKLVESLVELLYPEEEIRPKTKISPEATLVCVLNFCSIVFPLYFLLNVKRHYKVQ